MLRAILLGTVVLSSAGCVEDSPPGVPFDGGWMQPSDGEADATVSSDGTDAAPTDGTDASFDCGRTGGGSGLVTPDGTDSGQTDGTGAPEPEPTDGTDAPEPTDGTDAPEPTDGTDAPEPEPTDGTDGPKPEPTDGTDAPEPEPTDGTDGPEPTDGTDGPEPEPTDGTDSGCLDGTDEPEPVVFELRGYHVGNSLTLDSAPSWQAMALAEDGLEVTNAWHIQCGQPLVAIQDDPWTCFGPVEEYGPWPEALSGDHAWDYLTVQPFPGAGSTVGTDVAAIDAFLANLGGSQPDVFLYAAWTPNRDTFLEVWGANAPVTGEDPATVLRPAYFDALWAELDAIYGDRLYLVPVGEVMYQVGLQANAGEIEWLESHHDLFRDNVHASKVGQMIAALTHATVIAGQSLTVDAAIFDADQALVDRILEEIWLVVTADPRTGVD